MAPKALARAVRHGDAFMGAGASSTEAFAGAVPIVRRELDEQQKDPAHFPISKRVYLIVDDDVARGLKEVIDAGAETLLLNPLGLDVGENREQMERLAAEVIPQLG